MMDCHMIVDVNMALRPKRRKRIVGEAFTKASTIGLERPTLTIVVFRFTFWTHCWSEGDEQVDFFVQLWMNRQCSKSLCSPLTKPNITQTLGFGSM